MKKCSVCGTENFDTSVNCERCGYPFPNKFKAPPVTVIKQNEPSHGPSVVYVVKEAPRKQNTICTVAKVFMLISAIGAVVSLVGCFIAWVIFLALSTGAYREAFKPMAWAFFITMLCLIPAVLLHVIMTKSYIEKITENRSVGIGFKVCTLLFVNTIAGILMLCDEEH